MAVRTNRLALLAFLLLLAPAVAFAGLKAVGPVVPYIAGPPASGNGFPKYYVDQNGVAVDIQVPPFSTVGLVPPIMIFGPLPASPTPFMTDIGFDAEVFYFMIQPDPKSTTFAPPIDGTILPIDPKNQLGAFRPLIALEAGFASTGATINGLQAVWQRIRFDWFAAPDGFYRFTHPYGFEDMEATAGGGLKYTVDTQIIAQNFTEALGNNPNPLLAGKISQFLFQANPAPQISVLNPPIPPPYNKPTDWLGDGVTAATFTGSPLGPTRNFFRLEAFADAAHTIPLNLWPIWTPPPATPTGTTNVIETTLGVIAGHRYHLPIITGSLSLLLLD
jgi:hypothetical protein